MVTGEQSHSGYHNEVPDALVYVYVPSMIITKESLPSLAHAKDANRPKRSRFIAWLIPLIIKQGKQVSRDNQNKDK